MEPKTTGLNTMEVFDAIIGWGLFYPPADEDIDAEYKAAPQVVVDAYNAEGIDLTVYAPGDELWHQGPRAARWTIALHADWSVNFMDAIKRAGGPSDIDEDGDLWAKAKDLADAVEGGSHKLLAAWLEKHPDFNEKGVHWDADNFGYSLV